MAQLAHEKSTNALWGATPPPAKPTQQGQSGGGGLDDLLF